MYKTSKYYGYIFYADRNVRPCTILGYTITTFPKSRKTLMHNQSNRNLWHNCKRNKKQTKTKLHLIASRRTLQGDYIRETYGIHDDDAQFPGPFLYKEYCRNVLNKRFWGDTLILYAISCMWAVKISVVNSKTLQQYKVRHTAGLWDADIVLVYNSSSHYTAAGKSLLKLPFCASDWSLVMYFHGWCGHLYVSLDFQVTLAITCNYKWLLAMHIE